MSLIKVAYVTCSSYSGSTLLSFLLNDHPDIATVGHTTGWHVEPGEEFRCSCGALLAECPFYTRMDAIFDAAGLPHTLGDYGTAYRLSANDHVSRYLTSNLPFIRSPALERARDLLVRLVPGWRRTLARQDKANITFMRSALELARAKVFLDNSHRPYRLRRLAMAPDFDLSVIHVVRDFRGVVNSTMRQRKWGPVETTRAWLNEQVDCTRIAGDFPRRQTLFYEDLCNDLDGTLASLHGFLGLQPQPFSGDFKTREHHILGNSMRLQGGKVSKDARWRAELPPEHIQAITRTAQRYISDHPRHPVSAIVRRYLEEDPGASASAAPGS
jgi:hypothetical protein